MKLTKEKAIEISIELWTFLAETGKEKEEWDGWEKYGWMECYCPLCEYALRQSGEGYRDCELCPYHKRFGCCYSFYGGKKHTLYDHWQDAKTPRTRKKYARLFLEQLKQLI